MTSASHQSVARSKNGFWLALLLNFIWVNLSEIWRYLVVVRPMIQAIFPAQADKAPFTLPVFMSWSVWDTWLIFAATGFYWLYLNWAGLGMKQALIAATAFTITVFGLLWLGIVNMGLLPPHFIWNALPLAWVEQAVAAAIVSWVMRQKA